MRVTSVTQLLDYVLSLNLLLFRPSIILGHKNSIEYSMKKTFLISLLLTITALVANAQTNTVTGIIKDEQGNPLHFVFVGDMQNKYAVFTDSLGNFSIPAPPDSKLKVSLLGYKDEAVAAGNGNLQVVLKSAGDGAAEAQASVSTDLQTTNTNGPLATMGDGGVIAPTHQKGELRGSMYIFKNFAHGYVITATGDLNYNSNYLLDYDKVGGTLLLTQNKRVINEVAWDQIRSFVLYSNTDERFEFTKALDIDKSHYVQVLASGPKYKIYKLIKTKFVKADYVNSGVIAHGTDFDEYVDDADYFVVYTQTNQTQKLSLKKKSIKEDFAKDADKVNKYLSDNSGSINDDYLSKLGTYMNQ